MGLGRRSALGTPSGTTSPWCDFVVSDYSDYQTWREAVWDRHSGRGGFRLARAYDGDVLAGFAYGYTGETGQGGQTMRARCWNRTLRRHGWVGTWSW